MMNEKTKPECKGCSWTRENMEMPDDDEGYCYMFGEPPEGDCQKFKEDDDE